MEVGRYSVGMGVGKSNGSSDVQAARSKSRKRVRHRVRMRDIVERVVFGIASVDYNAGL